MTLTQDELKRHLSYDPDTGMFVRIASISPRVRVGEEPGTIRDDGYRCIRINSERYMAHRLAWLYVHGQWPANDIDHINGIRADNRIANLRCATRSENLCNQGKSKANKSGFKGVYWNKQRRKWQGELIVRGKRFYLGLYSDPAAAANAYAEAAAKHHGEFARA